MPLNHTSARSRSALEILEARSGQVTGVEALTNVIEMEEVAAIEEHPGCGDLKVVESTPLDSNLLSTN